MSADAWFDSRCADLTERDAPVVLSRLISERRWVRLPGVPRSATRQLVKPTARQAVVAGFDPQVTHHAQVAER